MILYHGSRGGLDGEISPVAGRTRTDFGKGFYTGTSPEQASSLVSGDSDPWFYKLDIPIETWPSDKVLRVNDEDWCFFVLYNRGRLEPAKGTPFYEKYKNLGRDADFIVGPIADDNLSKVLSDFAKNRITYPVLKAAISQADLGTQYVAKTPKACAAIQIVSERPIGDTEARLLRHVAEQNRQKGKQIAKEAYEVYRREGKYFNEILAEVVSKEIQKGRELNDSEFRKRLR